MANITLPSIAGSLFQISLGNLAIDGYFATLLSANISG